MKDITVGILGLGFVGITTAAHFSRAFNVIGYDVVESKIENFKNGIDITNQIGDRINKLGIEFTTDEKAISKMDVLIVCVQTPSKKDGINTIYLENVSHSIKNNMKDKALVVYSSSVYPGFCEEVVYPILTSSGKVLNEEFFVGYSPERISPGDPIELTEVTKVISASNDEALLFMESVFIQIYKHTFSVSNIKVAEAAKVLENTLRDVNISVLNQFREIFSDISIFEVQNAMATKWNALPFKSGLVGGHCIPVNPHYIDYAARKRNKKFTVIEESRRINEEFYLYFVDEIEKLQLKNKRILIKGITYKANVPDLRVSQMVVMYHKLQELGYTVYLEDPTLVLEHQKENLEILSHEEVEKLDVDCVIYGIIHEAYVNDNLNKYFEKGIYVLDVNGYFGRNDKNPLYLV